MKPENWNDLLGTEPSLRFVARVLAIGGLYFVLNNYAAEAVVNDFSEQFYYILAGCFWVTLGTKVVEYLTDISLALDVVERRNRAADIAVSGFIIGLTICYAGANVGEGPGPEAVFFTFLLAFIGLNLSLFLFRVFTGISDLITTIRSRWAAFRLVIFTWVVSLILGVTATGTWLGFEATTMDFLRALPGLFAFIFVLILVEKGIQKYIGNNLIH